MGMSAEEKGKLLLDYVCCVTRYAGSPYIWGGRGDVIWTPAGLKPHVFGIKVFDCSGLILVGWRDFCGTERRGSMNAQSLHDNLIELVPRGEEFNEFGALLFYGMSPKRVSHVMLNLGNGLVIEAAGGDETTTGIKAGAFVRIGRNQRKERGFLKAARLPLDTMLLTP